MTSEEYIMDNDSFTNVLSGKVLKVVIGELPGMTMIFRNATGAVTGYGGYVYEQLSWLSNRLNFSLDMQPIKGTDFGALVNGSWTGIRGQLQRKEVDIACSSFSGTLGFEIMDLAVYLVSDSYGILTRYPVPRTSKFGHIMTFSLNIWIGLFLSVLACIGCIRLLSVSYRKYLRPDTNDDAGFNTWGNICIYIFATLTNHGGYYRNNGNRSIGMMAFVWCLATFVFVNIYCSCLTSYMSLIFQRPDINSFRDLAESPNYQPATVEGATADIIFLRAKSGTMKEIGDKLRSCPKGVCRLYNFDQTIQKVLEQDGFVTFIPFTYGEVYIRKAYTNRECHLTMAQEAMANNNYFMGVPKNSSLVNELNRQSFWWHSLGLQEYWKKKMVPKTPQCKLDYNNRGEAVQLVERARIKLEQFYVAFAVLFAGYILALLQFIRERLYSTRYSTLLQ